MTMDTKILKKLNTKLIGEISYKISPRMKVYFTLITYLMTENSNNETKCEVEYKRSVVKRAVARKNNA